MDSTELISASGPVTLSARKVNIVFRFKNFEAINSKFERIPKFEPEWEASGILSRRQYDQIIDMGKKLNRGPKFGKNLKPVATPIVLLPLGFFTPVLKSISYIRTEENTKKIRKKLTDIGLTAGEFTVKQYMDFCRVPIGYTIYIEGVQVTASQSQTQRAIMEQSVGAGTYDGPMDVTSILMSQGMLGTSQPQQLKLFDLTKAGVAQMMSTGTFLVMVASTSATYFMLSLIGQ